MRLILFATDLPGTPTLTVSGATGKEWTAREILEWDEAEELSEADWHELLDTMSGMVEDLKAGRSPQPRVKRETKARAAEVPLEPPANYATRRESEPKAIGATKPVAAASDPELGYVPPDPEDWRGEMDSSIDY